MLILVSFGGRHRSGHVVTAWNPHVNIHPSSGPKIRNIKRTSSSSCIAQAWRAKCQIPSQHLDGTRTTRRGLHSTSSLCLSSTKSPLDAAGLSWNSSATETITETASYEQQQQQQQQQQEQHSQEEIDELTRTWRELPSFNQSLRFPCWRVPKQASKVLQTILESPLTQPYLVSRMEFWEHVQRGRAPKVIQEDTDNKNHKLVLLHPNTPTIEELPEPTQQLLNEGGVQTTDAATGKPILFDHQLRPSDFTAAYILETLLPPHLHPPPASFETIGHVAHLNLRDIHLPFRYLIGQVLLETLSETLETVIHKVGQVSGPYRTYEHEVLATTHTDSDKSTVVSLLEWGIRLQFDVQDVYWCSRLSQERRRLIKEEFRPGQWIADPFSGVGALCLQAALHKKCIITANDWNPAAIQALKQNAQRNKLEDSFYQITCGDAYEFLTGLGIQQRARKKEDPTSTKVKSLPSPLPHHVVMNFPLKAATFLGALRWWPLPGGRKRRKQQQPSCEENLAVPRVHVYTFAREQTNQEEDEEAKSAEEMAVDEIASHLLPVMTGQETTPRSKTTKSRWKELDENFGCDVKVHNVRDVAPGKVVLCVSFSATERLLRHMQGDFSSD